jgi:hypothetical protein
MDVFLYINKVTNSWKFKAPLHLNNKIGMKMSHPFYARIKLKIFLYAEKAALKLRIINMKPGAIL